MNDQLTDALAGEMDLEAMASALDWGFGRARAEYDLRRINLARAGFDFRPHARHYCEQVSGLDLRDVAVEDFHRHLPVALQVPNEVNLNACTHRADDTSDPALYRDYIRLVLHIANHVLGRDLVFEARPAMRLHFPQPAPDNYRLPSGEMACYHNDMMFGEYGEQFNCWLSITRCRGSSGLQVAGLTDSCRILGRFIGTLGLSQQEFGESRVCFFEWLRDNEAAHRFVASRVRPLETEPNEMVMFDPVKIHGTAENVEDATRASIDFRVLPADDYDQIMAAMARRDEAIGSFDGMRHVRGDYYHRQTIREYAAATGLTEVPR